MLHPLQINVLIPNLSNLHEKGLKDDFLHKEEKEEWGKGRCRLAKGRGRMCQHFLVGERKPLRKLLKYLLPVIDPN